MRLNSIKYFIVLLVGLLPPSTFKNFALRSLGWTIERGSQIGISIFFRIDKVVLGRDSRIGSGNVIRSLAKLQLGESSRLGQWNWVSAATPLRAAGAAAQLVLGDHSALTSRHYVDASGGVTIGNHSTIAGVRTTFITHGIDWRTSEQTFRGIKIHDYCLLSSNLKLTPGTTVQSRVVVGMGAVLSGTLSEGSLYISERATAVRTELNGDYFSRDTGFISEVRNT